MSTRAADGNPYVGPRPFEPEEQSLFFGRDREAEELLALIFAHPAVLFYTQSGAGKTSLLNARLIPLLEQQEFEVFPIARVSGALPQDVDPMTIPNLYIYNCLLSWMSPEDDPKRLLSMKLPAFLQERPHLTDEIGEPRLRALLFDQFEELFSQYPERWEEREEFFQQVAEALVQDSLLRIAFAIREDYLAQVDPYARLLPGRLRARFRMERLRKQAALDAVELPLRDRTRCFAEGVAEQLVEELLRVRVTSVTGETVEIAGEFVEPVQLQVVCQSLWRDLPDDATVITRDDLQAFGDVDQALSGFYERSLSQAAEDTGVREGKLRALFERSLITPAGTRGTVNRGLEETGGIRNAAVDVLEKLHLIRGEWRAGARWYELTHDRLIEPIQKSNETWRATARRKRWLPIGAGMAVVLILLLVMTPPEIKAPRLARLASSRQVAAFATNILETDPELSLLLALQAVMVTYSEDRTVTSEAEGALHRAMHAPIAQLSLSGHTGAVRDIAFSPDGTRLATASADRTAKVWDLEASAAATSGHELFTLTNHTDTVHSVAFSPDGKRLATASRDETAKVWDVASEEELFTLSGHGGAVRDVTFNRDGTRLATASAGGTVTVWDAVSGRGIFTGTGHTDVVYGVEFSPDGKRLATASADGTAKVWSTDSGQELFTLVHTDWVYGVSFSPDGTRLATASADKTAKLWDADSGEELLLLSGHTEAVTDIAFSPDGKRLATASADGTAKVWNVAVGTELFTLSGHANEVWTVSFSPDGKRLATASADRTAKVWSTDSGQELPTLLGHAGWVYGVSFSRDGTRLATASADTTAKIWKVDSGEESFTLTGHTDIVHGVAFSPECVSPPEAPAERCGTRLATASADQTVKVWDADSGQELFPLAGHTHAVWDVAFSTDGQRLATASRDGTAKVWDADSGEELSSLRGHTDAVWQVTFSPDGTRLATASADGTAKVWDVTSRKELFTLADHTDVVFGVAFSPDGRRVATASRDKTARLWALEGSADDDFALKLLNLYAHDDSVYSVAFNVNGTRLATATGDGTALVWDAESGRKLFSLSGQTGAVWDIAFSPDGRRLATASPDGTVRVYVLGIEELMTLAKERVTRSLTPEECKRYLDLEQCPPLP